MKNLSPVSPPPAISPSTSSPTSRIAKHQRRYRSHHSSLVDFEATPLFDAAVLLLVFASPFFEISRVSASPAGYVVITFIIIIVIVIGIGMAVAVPDVVHLDLGWPLASMALLFPSFFPSFSPFPVLCIDSGGGFGTSGRRRDVSGMGMGMRSRRAVKSFKPAEARAVAEEGEGDG